MAESASLASRRARIATTAARAINTPAARDAPEIIAIEHAIIASITPEDKPLTLRWMLPALSPQVRAMMAGMLRANLPPEAMAGIMAILKPHLSGANWRKLTEALDKLPAAA